MLILSEAYPHFFVPKQNWFPSQNSDHHQTLSATVLPMNHDYWYMYQPPLTNYKLLKDRKYVTCVSHLHSTMTGTQDRMGKRGTLYLKKQPIHYFAGVRAQGKHEELDKSLILFQVFFFNLMETKLINKPKFISSIPKVSNAIITS